MPRLRLCLFSPRGELLIQRRQLRKDRYPGCWDVSAGGFVRSGEEPAQAVLREAREELGLVLSPAELRYELTEPFSFVLDDFYSARRELAPSSLRLQEEELSQVCWAGPAGCSACWNGVNLLTTPPLSFPAFLPADEPRPLSPPLRSSGLFSSR